MPLTYHLFSIETASGPAIVSFEDCGWEDQRTPQILPASPPAMLDFTEWLAGYARDASGYQLSGEGYSPRSLYEALTVEMNAGRSVLIKSFTSGPIPEGYEAGEDGPETSILESTIEIGGMVLERAQLPASAVEQAVMGVDDMSDIKRLFKFLFPQEVAAEDTVDKLSSSTALADNGISATVGVESAVAHSDGDDKAYYAVMDIRSVVPSHDPNKGFVKNGAYPEGAQERPYHSDDGEQQKVKRNAMRLNPRFLLTDNPDAVNGPPILTSKGVVMGGNSRTMSLLYAYENFPDKANAYKKELKERASIFGIPESEVDKYAEPVLVRVVDGVANKDLAHRSRVYNQTFMQGLDVRAEGVSKGKLVSADSITKIAKAVDEFGSIREYLNSPKSREIIDSLQNDGVIEETQLAKLTNKIGLLTEDGKRLVEQVVRGKAIDDFDLLNNITPAMAQKLDKILAPLSIIKARGGEWDITPKLKAALWQSSKYAVSKAETPETFWNQHSLFSAEDAVKNDPVVSTLFFFMVKGKPTQIAEAWGKYAKAASMSVSGGMALPGLTLETPETAFAKAFNSSILESAATTEGTYEMADVLESVQDDAISAINSALSWDELKSAFMDAFDLEDDSTSGKGSRREYVDMGEKIGGARKDMWVAISKGERSIEPDDMEGMDSATARKLVTKKNTLQGVVQTLVDSEVEPSAAWAMNKVFNSYAVAPNDNDTARKQYVSAAAIVRTRFMGCKTLDDLKQALDVMKDEMKGYALSPEEKALEDAYNAKGAEWRRVRREAWQEISKKHYKGIKFDNYGASKELYAWEAENRKNYLTDEEIKARNIQAKEWNLREEDDPDSKRNLYRSLGDRFTGIILGNSKAFNDNLEAAKSIKDYSWLDPKEAKKPRGGGEKKERWSRQVPDEVVRNGGADRDFKPQDLLDTFKIRGVEYGNWVDEKAAAHHTKMLGLGFMDMSTVLDIPMEHISHGGRLAIAFGARGSGFAAAHYEPGRKVINMTKLNGGGSLAHEWGHFLDNIVHMASTGGESQFSYTTNAMSGKNIVRGQAVQSFGDKISPEVKDAFQEVYNAMVAGEAGRKASESKMPENPRMVAYYDRVVGGMLERYSPQQTMDFYGKQTNRRWSKKQGKYIEKPAHDVVTLQAIANYIHAKTGKQVQYGPGTSQFYHDSANMTNGYGESYWTRPHELFARAFEAVIAKKMRDRNMRNSYLVSGVDEGPYPFGEELDRLEAAFDNAFAKIKQHGVLEAALALTEALDNDMLLFESEIL